MTLMTLTSDIHSGSVSWNRFYWWGSQSHGSMIRRSPTIGNQRRKPASKSPLRTPHRTWRRRPGEEDLEKKMGTPLTPAHVLVLAHSTTDQSIDSTFDGAGRNSFVSISPLSVADHVRRWAPRLLQHMCWYLHIRRPINRLTVPSTALVEIRLSAFRHSR